VWPHGGVVTRSLRRCSRTPLLRFHPLQRVPTAMRCPGRPSLRTIPLRRFSPACDPRVPWNFVGPSPAGVALAVLRSSDAMRLCSMWGRSRAAELATLLRRVDAAAKRLHAISNVCGHVVRAPIGETDRPRSRATRHIKRHRFAGTFGPLIRCLSRVMHRRVPWRGVPLPSGSSLRGLVGRAGPSLSSSGGAHGVQHPSQACSRTGWPVISDRPGPRAVLFHFIQPD
jgi:hypothetical protein